MCIILGLGIFTKSLESYTIKPTERLPDGIYVNELVEQKHDTWLLCRVISMNKGLLLDWAIEESCFVSR